MACSHPVRTGRGKVRADHLAASLPRKAWQRLSAGGGSKGPRFYDWAWISIEPDRPDAQGQRWLLVRRNNATGEFAYYRCWSPAQVPLRELVGVAGRRWTVEESFQASKTLAGLDQHQVRRWDSWHRWTILAMLAYALLAVLAATQRAEPPTPPGLIALPATRSTACSTHSSSNQYTTCDTDCTGQTGDADTNTAPEPSTTTADKPPQHEHHKLRLSY